MKLKILWLTIGFIFVLLLIVASLIPDPPNPADFRGGDKLEHFAEYAFMMLLLGITPEYFQRLSGYRTFEYADMGANVAGVLCALLLAQTRLSRSLAVVERLLIRIIG